MRTIIEPPLPELHQHLMQFRPAATASPPHDALAAQIVAYQNAANDPQRLHQIASVSNNRVIRDGMRLPLDVLSAYERLARVARWRAYELEARNGSV